MDPSSIPKQYGGDLDWEWGDMPNLDEPARELVGGLETPPEGDSKKPGFTKGPVLFKGDHVEVLGSVDGKPRRKTIPVPKKQQQDQNENEKADAGAAKESEPAQDGENEKAAPPEQQSNGAAVESQPAA